jgi:hypothetical protein
MSNWLICEYDDDGEIINLEYVSAPYGKPPKPKPRRVSASAASVATVSLTYHCIVCAV